MKVLFAGYGSIARRHIQNLYEICGQKGEKLEVDLLRYTSSEVPEGVQRVFTSAGSIDADYDAIFITNPTSVHYETLLALLDHSDFFFVEKPVFDRPDVDIAPLLRADKFSMLHARFALRMSYSGCATIFPMIRSLECAASVLVICPIGVLALIIGRHIARIRRWAVVSRSI